MVFLYIGEDEEEDQEEDGEEAEEVEEKEGRRAVTQCGGRHEE